MKRQVSLNNQSFDRAGITKDCQDAICEYIWNGFEAGATNVAISFRGTPFTEAVSLEITDNGTGIPYDNLDDTFGTFLSSIKNNSSIRLKSQANKGKGRFSYLSFSHCAKWTTVYESNDTLKRYTITTDSSDRSQFDTSEPENVGKTEHTGTSVTFPLFDANITDQLLLTNMRQKLLEEFAWFLYLHKSKGYSLDYLGEPIDFSEYIDTSLSNDFIVQIDQYDFSISVIVWKNNVANSSKIYYLTENSQLVTTENTSFNKNKVGFYHAVYVASKFFKHDMFLPLGQDDNQSIIETENGTSGVFRELGKLIRELVSSVLKSFLIIQADTKLMQMKERGNYPRFSDDEYGNLRKKDFETVTKELYCVEPKIFYKLNDTQERSLLGFLNLLLSSEERENVLQIVEQIVSLTPDQRKSFANVLQRSQLQYIVEAISVIEKRIAVVEHLKKIIYDYKSFANERDHIQKIIEQHFWLFGEQYHMLTADKNLATSLKEYEKITEHQPLLQSMQMTDQEIQQRVDIFLYSQRVQENSNSEMLIIELKSPHIKLSIDVFNQIVRYANTIRKEPRFNSENRTWRFFAICSEVDEDVKIKYKNFEHLGKRGLADVIGNFELYALSWDDIFQSFESQHSFMLGKLKIDYAQVSSALGLSDNGAASREKVTELTQKLIAMNA